MSVCHYLHVMFLVGSVFSSLPAPVKVHMDSVNLRHVLCWTPGPGTPPRTEYQIFTWENKRRPKTYQTSTTTCLKLKLNNMKTVSFSVRASNNHSVSSMSHKTPNFTPIEHTHIGRPNLSLVGCGNCLRVNISQPEADRSSGVHDIMKYFNAKFRVSWKKPEKAENVLKTEDTSFTLDNLEKGQMYCVQAQMESSINANTDASDWTCALTSSAGSNSVPAVVGAVAVLLIAVISILTMSTFALYYTGWLCKLQTSLPEPLINALIQSKILQLDRTTPDPISVTAEGGGQKTSVRPGRLLGEGSDDDDDEEEERKLYIKRASSSDEGSSVDASAVGRGERRLLVPAVSQCPQAASTDADLTPKLPAQEPDDELEAGDMCRLLDQDEDEEAELWLQPMEGVTGFQGHVGEGEDMKGKTCDSEVNLFTVTLAALSAGEEEEEHCDLQLELHTDTDRTLLSMTPEGADEEARGCETTQGREEEEEDEGYMRRI